MTSASTMAPSCRSRSRYSLRFQSALWVLAASLAAASPVFAGGPPTQGAAVAASAGGQATGGGFTLGFTLGEAVIGLSLAPSVPMVQMAGFWSVGSGPVLGIGDEAGTLAPQGLSLAIAPNPFTSTTEIRLVLPARTRDYSTSIRLFDTSGRLVRELVLPKGVVGPRSVTWDGSDHAGRTMPGGIYHCRIESGPFIENRRIAHIH